MKVMKSRFLKCLFGAMAVIALSATAPFASADTLTIDSTLSVLNFTVDLVDPSDPSTSIASAVGQGDIPDGTIPVGDGTRIPGFSNGLSAQASGTIDVTVGGGLIDVTGGANTFLLDSGSWQPGVGAAPDPGNLGIFMQFTLANPNDSVVVASLRSLILDALFSTPVPLDGGGNFDDPAGIFSILSGNLNGFASTPIGGGAINSALPATPSTNDYNGTYIGGVLTLPVNTQVLVDVSAQVGFSLGVLIGVQGQLVATSVPEPSSIALLGMGLVGLVAAGYRRIRK